MGTKTRRTATDLALPEVDAVIAALPADLVDSESDLRARVRLARLNTEVGADASDLQAAIDLLRSRAAGELDASPFGDPIHAETFDELVDIGERALAGGRLDLATVLALQHEAGAIAARQGRRLILFLGVSSEIRRLAWDLSTAELARRGDPAERYTELGRLLLLWTEMSSLAMGEGYRATERELLARDVEARRAALDELLGAVSNDARAGARLRRLAMRYGLDPDAAFRVAAIHPGPEADPTPEEAGFDDEDLDALARRIDQRIRRQGSRDGIGSGIRVPLAVSWRGAIVAILGSDPQEWRRLQEAVSAVLGASGGGRDAAAASSDPTWTAIAMRADGVRALARAMVELQEGLRVADGIGRHGVIDDVAELGVERLLLSDPDLAATIIERELGPLLADPRMGEELVETLQTYFDAGGNRRETARRLHLADRTVAYRLERAEDLLGHGFDGEGGPAANVALTLRRLAQT